VLSDGLRGIIHKQVRTSKLKRFGGRYIASEFSVKNFQIRRWWKARAGKNSFPPTLFLFARPSVQFLPREARQSIGIPFKVGSHCVQ